MVNDDERELIGTSIADRFEVRAHLGTGGMANVYRAWDREQERMVAVKLLKAKIAHIPEAAERLRREGEVLTRFAHPAIVGVEHVGKLPDGRLFLAMEYLRGRTLGTMMRTAHRMDADDLAPILAGTVAGLSVAHAGGIVHRDLKPDNIFLQELPGGDFQVKLLDFGISKIIGYESLTRTGQVLGTPRYMAPEQLSALELDPRVDIYALGVILYEALSGKPPFVGDTPDVLVRAILSGRVTPLRSLVPELPAGLDVVVERAMARAKEARYDQASELLDAFIRCLAPNDPRWATGPSDQTNALGSEDAWEVKGDGIPKEISPVSFADFTPTGSGGHSSSAVPIESVEAAAAAALSGGGALPGDPRAGARATAGRRHVIPRGLSRGWIVAILTGALIAGAATAGLLLLALSHSGFTGGGVSGDGSSSDTADPGGGASAETHHRAALDAQERGDFGRCIREVRSAEATTESATLAHLEGECFEALGDRENAVKSFERYCRLATATDPRRALVDARLRALGGRCASPSEPAAP